jgi:hypothetical protein
VEIFGNFLQYLLQSGDLPRVNASIRSKLTKISYCGFDGKKKRTLSSFADFWNFLQPGDLPQCVRYTTKSWLIMIFVSF